MEPSLDKAMLGMTLEEDEEPYTIPDRPEFYSTERNILSLVGRLLNPHCQGMKDLILDMPRKWQLYDRVRGVALSKDRFQFIFKYEHDLIDILNRGVHTSNQWSLAMERWVERPPPDFLQFIEVWVQMRNIPVNHYTKAALTDLAEFAGQVIEVAFDPNKPQTNDYIRAKVKFDVSKPLRRFKTVNVPGGEVVKILYDYERLQKRCYTCQRLTHEQSSCHFFQAAKAAALLKEKGSVCLQKPLIEKTIREDDPLFGVVLESQVGINPQNGKPKIAEEVLEGMRQYLVDAEGAEKMARKERIKWSLKEVEQDPIAQKSFLRLEPAPIFTSDLDKGKGIVFDFQSQKELPKDVISHGGSKLMASAIRVGNAMSLEPRNMGMMSDTAAFSDSATGSWNPRGPTGYNIGISDACSSGTKGRKTYQRRRPGSFVRKARGKYFKAEASREGKMKDKAPAVAEKRKSSNDVETSQYSPRSKKPAVVPNEGPPNL
ncbi:uncharacterized protein LOC106427221 [Brassica napus]|uniref:uncharacterized protein LOC106427221 n=1 Tax=Brassica napus TaxID=3708 RepID=UPI0006AB7520|nr:uncharacterized protein LOC106427221 [Brassica napus]